MVCLENLMERDLRMDNTKSDFEDRKKEVEEYFLFLEIFNYDDIKVQYRQSNEVQIKEISTRLQTMFLANAFLILYNLIESTIINSIIEIYNKVSVFSANHGTANLFAF